MEKCLINCKEYIISYCYINFNFSRIRENWVGQTRLLACDRSFRRRESIEKIRRYRNNIGRMQKVLCCFRWLYWHQLDRPYCRSMLCIKELWKSKKIRHNGISCIERYVDGLKLVSFYSDYSNHNIYDNGISLCGLF